jgi:hypothetical protein
MGVSKSLSMGCVLMNTLQSALSITCANSEHGRISPPPPETAVMRHLGEAASAFLCPVTGVLTPQKGQHSCLTWREEMMAG